MQRAKAAADLLPRTPKQIAAEARSNRPSWPAPAPYKYLKLDKRNDTNATVRIWPQASLLLAADFAPGPLGWTRPSERAASRCPLPEWLDPQPPLIGTLGSRERDSWLFTSVYRLTRDPRNPVVEA